MLPSEPMAHPELAPVPRRLLRPPPEGEVEAGGSLTSYFGLGLDYAKGWVGRYFAQESDFITLVAAPSAAYRVNEWLSVGGSVGLVYGRFQSQSAISNDSSPVSKSNRLVALPLDRQLRYSFGVLYDWNENVPLGLACQVLDAGDAKIRQSRPFAGTLVGDYSPNHIQFANVNLVWRL